MTIDYAHARELMVEQQIRPWDVLDIRVLDVLARLPREAFVAESHRALAYADIELPLGNGHMLHFTVSIGVCVFAAQNVTPEGLLKAADQAHKFIDQHSYSVLMMSLKSSPAFLPKASAVAP